MNYHLKSFVLALLVVLMWMSTTSVALARVVWGGFDASRLNYPLAPLTSSIHSILRNIILNNGGVIGPLASQLTPAYLSSIDVFYTSFLSPSAGTLSASEQAALSAWIAQGGTLIVTAEHPPTAYASVTAAYGVTNYIDLGTDGTVGMPVASHPITENVHTYCESAGTTFSFGPDAKLLGVNGEGLPFMVVLEPETGFNAGGRILVIGDHNLFQDFYMQPNSPCADLNGDFNPEPLNHDHQVLAANIAKWAASACKISNVPLYKQWVGPLLEGIPYWEDDPYGENGNFGNMAQYGCGTTSAAMLLAKLGVISRGILVNPGELNDRLQSQTGGYKGGDVNWVEVARLARNNGVTLYYQGSLSKSSTSDDVLNDFLCKLKMPVIVRVPGHFVLATGQATVNRVDTWSINDPKWNSGVNLTNLTSYGNTYDGLRLFSTSASGALLVGGAPAIEILAIDPLGHRAGFDPATGSLYEEIPNSSYISESLDDDSDSPGAPTPKEKIVEIMQPLDGMYTIQVYGVEEGTYTIHFFGYDTGQTPTGKSIITGTTAPGAVQTYLVFYASAPGSGFTVQAADTAPPVITVSANPATLWPPNGKMVPVTISGTITDATSGVNVGTATYAVTDEYSSVQPSEKVTLRADGSYSFTIQLQASRNGNDKDGRHYTITVKAQDNAGNKGSASTAVIVPHDQGK